MILRTGNQKSWTRLASATMIYIILLVIISERILNGNSIETCALLVEMQRRCAEKVGAFGQSGVGIRALVCCTWTEALCPHCGQVRASLRMLVATRKMRTNLKSNLRQSVFSEQFAVFLQPPPSNPYVQRIGSARVPIAAHNEPELHEEAGRSDNKKLAARPSRD